MRYAIAAVVVVVMGVAVIGIGMGDPPKNDPAPTGAELAASKQRIASGGKMVAEGREEFEEEGCDTCHAIAATGAEGVLGPRMDTQGDSASEIRNNIIHPRADIAEGFEANLMPTDYAKRMDPDEIKAVVAFIKAASGKGGEHEGKGGDGDEG